MRVNSGAGVTRYVRRDGAAAWADEKAQNYKYMRTERRQVAYAYIRTARTED